MIKFNFIIFLFFTFFSFSCTNSTYVRTDMARIPSPKRIYLSSLTKHKENTGIVIIKLDKGTILAPLICPQKILIDQKPVAELRAGEKLVLYLSPGIHNLQTIPQSVCKLFPTGPGILSTTFNIRKNEKLIFRIKRGFSGQFYITLEQKEFQH